MGNRSMAGVVSQADCWEGCNKEDAEWGLSRVGGGGGFREGLPGPAEPRRMERICNLSKVGEAERWW